MAYCVETTTYNGYRCGCCQHTYDSRAWFENLADALAELPREFPIESEWGGTLSVKIRDGATGADIASSVVTFPPGYQRGDPYKYTAWSLYIDEDACPGQGTSVHQIIEGKRHQDEPIKLVTRSWSDICADLAEARRQVDIRKAEADRADAERRLNNLRGSGTP